MQRVPMTANGAKALRAELEKLKKKIARVFLLPLRKRVSTAI